MPLVVDWRPQCYLYPTLPDGRRSLFQQFDIDITSDIGGERPGGAESLLGKNAAANGEEGRGMGLSRMSTPSSEFPVFSDAGYPGDPSLSSETHIESVDKGDSPDNHCDRLRPCSGEAVVRGREMA
jgi:hypothetical protein